MSQQHPQRPSAPHAVQAVVQGRVQGVGFRDFVFRQAWRLGIVGTVRNLPSGREVAVYAEGSQDALRQFTTALRQGPPGALVHRVQEEWVPASGEYEAFHVQM